MERCAVRVHGAATPSAFNQTLIDCFSKKSKEIKRARRTKAERRTKAGVDLH